MDVLERPATVAIDSAASGQASRRRERMIVGSIIGVVGIFLFATIRPGHGWEDDFALYISHAKNLLAGRPYGATGYLYNPAVPFGGPRTYPPVYPLLLVPVIKAFGLSLYAMKVEVVAFFLGALAAVYAYARRHFSFGVAAGAVAVLGFSPFFWDFKDNVLSDIPFLFFVVASLIAIDRTTSAERASIGRGLALGALMYVAYGTRTMGVVLPVAFVVTELVRRRRVTRSTLAAVALFSAAAVAQGKLIAGGGSYADDLKLQSVHLAIVNAWRYVRALERIAFNGFSMAAAGAFFAALIVLAAVGYVSRLRRERFGPAEAFVPLYALVVVAWPIYQDTRLLIPIIPFFVLYSLSGLGILTGALRRQRLRSSAVVALMLAFALSYVTLYSKLDFGPIKTGVERPDTRAAFAYVRGNTSAGDVVIFRRPKALALYASRRSTGYSTTLADAAQLRYFASIHARWLLASHLDPPYLHAFIARNTRSFTTTYRNSEYALYRIVY